jgi:hypothetical protein
MQSKAISKTRKSGTPEQHEYAYGLWNWRLMEASMCYFLAHIRMLCLRSKERGMKTFK